MYRTTRSFFALLALALFLATGTAHAVPSSNGPSPERASGMMAAAWDWLASAFGLEDVLAPIFEASSGTGLAQKPAPPTAPQTDFGGFIDPNGGH